MSWARHGSEWFDEALNGLPLFAAATSREYIEEWTKQSVSDCTSEAYIICGDCWQYTKTNPCENCDQRLDEYGQAVDKDVLFQNTEIEPPSSKEEKTTTMLVWFNGTEYRVESPKTIKETLSVCIHIWAQKYRVIINPFIRKKVIKVYNHGKRRYVSKDIFWIVSWVASVISHDPKKYGLSHLKVFKN